MRVLVAADAMAGLGARAASTVIATAFADTGAEVAVIPLADGGVEFADAVAAMEPAGIVVQPNTIPETLTMLANSDGRCGTTATLWLDLTRITPFPWSELTAVSNTAMDAMATALGQRRLVAIVAPEGQETALTGLSGRVAERGRVDGHDLAETLEANDTVSAWLDAMGLDGATPGSGAADGLGAIVLALGGRVMTGTAALVEGFGMESTVDGADLLVTGTSVLDFHAVGGHVVKEVARMGTEASRPVIAIVGRNFVSTRELRVAGIESAHALIDGMNDEQPHPDQLAQVAGRVAKSWSW